MGDIRKISVGADYKTAMHYIVGQDILGGNYKINTIYKDEVSDSFKIWIEDNDSVIVLWKEFNKNMPISIEYNINF